jgi:hypothetical protein
MKIVQVENRGTETTRFGYIYFDDGARVAYAQGDWAVSETARSGELTSGPEHVKAAKAWLDKDAWEEVI